MEREKLESIMRAKNRAALLTDSNSMSPVKRAPYFKREKPSIHVHENADGQVKPLMSGRNGSDIKQQLPTILRVADGRQAYVKRQRHKKNGERDSVDAQDVKRLNEWTRHIKE